MKSNIRVTLSDTATSDLLQLMKELDISNPTHAANIVIHKFYLSLREELNNEPSSTSNQ